MLVKILGEEDIEDNNKSLVKKDTCGIFNTFLRGVFRKHKLAGHGVKARNPSVITYCKGSYEKFMQIIPRDRLEKIKKKYPEKFVSLPYKVELANA